MIDVNLLQGGLTQQIFGRILVLHQRYGFVRNAGDCHNAHTIKASVGRFLRLKLVNRCQA